MTRALTFQDLIGQLNGDSAESIDLNSTEVVNEYVADMETCLVTQSVIKISNTQLLVPYDVGIQNDAGPSGYWRLNEFSNVLTVTDQSFENGIGSWTASASTIAVSTTQAKDGTHSLQVTATGANGAAFTNTLYRVQANAAYAGSYWVFSTVASRNFSCQFNWYDSTGTLLSSTTTNTVTPTINTWTQVALSTTSPANAVFCIIEPFCSNSANGNIYYIDIVQYFQVGYDSSALAGLPGFTKNSAASVAANSALLCAQPGPYLYPDGSALPGSTLFTTVNDGLSVTSVAQLQITADLTVELWINPHGNMSGSVANLYGLVSKGYAEFGLDLYGDGSLGFSFTGTSVIKSPAATIPNTNTWHHVVVSRTFATRNVTIYVDGAQVATSGYTNSPSATSNAVTIGKSSAQNTLVSLAVAEVAIYGRALTAAQALYHYNLAGYGTIPSNQKVTGSGWGLGYTATGGNVPSEYGPWGYLQYPTPPAPTTSAYDVSGAWGSFTWG